MDTLPHLSFCETLFAYVCLDEKCKTVVKLENLKQHIQRKHQITQPVSKRMTDVLLKAVSGKVPGIRARRYFEDPLPRDGESPLPALPLLPIFEILKCPCCPLFLNGVTACKAHMRTFHRNHEQYDELMRNLKEQPLVKGQSLFGGHARRYFPVTCESPTIHSDGLAGSFIISSDKDGGSRTTEADELSLHDKSVNLTCTTLGIPEFLKSQSLTLDRAYDLSRVDGSTRVKIVSVLLAYINHFAEMQPPVPIPLLDGIRIRNGDAAASFSLSIENRSKKKYANVAARFINLAVAVGQTPLPGFTLDSEAKNAAAALLDMIISTGTASLLLVHNFFRAILLQKPRASMGEMVTIEGLFKILIAGYTCGVQTKRIRIGDSDDASHTAAAMQYFCHIAALGEFFVSPIGFGVRTDESEEARFGRVRSLLSTEACSPAAYIRTVLLKSKRLSAGESPKIDFVACPNHKYCGTVQNIEVQLNSDQPGSLGYVVRSLQRDVSKVMQEDLMKNFLVPPDFVSSVLSFTDKLNEKEPGYFFGSGSEAKEKMRSWSEAFARHLTKGETPLIQRMDFGSGEEYGPTSRASTWLRKVDEVVFLLYVLVHLCGGGPPRVSEMVETKLRNTASSRRNVFIIKQRLAILGCYSKTSKQHQAPKPIARFLDSRTTELILRFLVYIKPVQCFFLGKSMLTVKATEDYLFSQSGEKIDEPAVCKAFGKALNSRGLPLNVRLYRQWRTGVAKAFLTEEKKQSDEGLLFLQAGHTEATALFRYADGDFNVGTLSLAKLEGFYNVSRMWHRLLGIDETKPLTPSERSRALRLPNSMTKCTDQIQISTNTPNTGLDTVTEMHVKERSVKRSRCKGIKEIVYHGKKLKRSTKNVNDYDLGKGHVELQNSILECAAELLGCTKGKAINFKSEAQRAALYDCSLHTVLSGYTSSMIVILPTGGGKTLCWAAAVLREQRISDHQQMKTPLTVLIVPLISLQQDVSRKCQESGIRCGMWDDRFRDDLSVLICSIDATFSNDYERFIVALSVQGRVARIVVDEAHLILLWQDLRGFSALAGRLRPANVKHVPLVCFSATLTDTMVSKLQDMLRMDQSCVKLYRALNSRPNISYQVRMIAEQSSKKMIEHCNQLMRMEMDAMSSSERGIAFCLTVKDCIEMHKSFSAFNSEYEACIYHGSMSNDEKNSSFETWINSRSEKPVAMIATSAFSCGIDYPHVRIVIHVGGSRTIVELAQESGRAGRDGVPAKNLIVYSPKYLKSRTTHLDKHSQQIHEEGLFGDVTELLGSKTKCRREAIESFLNSNSRGPCTGVEQKCDACERSEASFAEFPTSYTNLTRSKPQVDGESTTIAVHRKRVSVDPALLVSHSDIPIKKNTSITQTMSQISCIKDSMTRLVDSTFKGDWVHQWHAKQISLAECAVCIFNGKKMQRKSESQGHDDCMRAICFRCMEPNANHQSKECQVTPRGEESLKRCFFCGIPQKAGLHSKGSFDHREKCEWKIPKNLALIMWRVPGERYELVKLIPELRECKTMVEAGIHLCGGRGYDTKLTKVLEYMYTKFVIEAKRQKAKASDF